MPALPHELHSRIIKPVLELHMIWHKLVMQPWSRERLGGREALVDRVDDVLDCGRDDPAAACGTGN
jgi:hypothetical protein